MVASLRSIDSIVTIWAMFYKTAEGEGLSCDDDDEKGKYDGWFFSLIMTLAQNTFYELLFSPDLLLMPQR